MNRRYHYSLLLLLVPYLLGTLVLVVVPLLLTLPLALTEYNGLGSPSWVGLAHLQGLLSDPLFLTASGNTFYYTALLVPLRVLVALALALLLNRRRGLGLYRAAVYVPTVVPGVAYALIWLWLLNPLYGPLNGLLAFMGLPAPAWLADPATALPALVLAGLFQLGESFVVLLAGLSAIPRDYYQVAALDGAGPWQRFRYVTLPLISPWLLLVVMRELIASVQNSFTPALLMTGGGPYYATLFLPQLIYNTAFDQLRFGQAAAMTLVHMGSIIIALLVIYRLSGGWGYDDEV
jgi:multiple sugar transport system permease protein